MEPITCMQVAQHIAACLNCQAYTRKLSAKHAGKSRSLRKIEASRLNGLKGGRPKKL